MSDPESFETTLDALVAALALKTESRTGWERHGLADPESVAAHSWGVTLLVVLTADEWTATTGESVDVARAMRLAIVHDLGEAVAGDVPATADRATRRAAADREKAALAAFGEAFGQDLAAHYRELERGETPEARFIRELDKLEMLIQAVAYERAADQPLDLGEFFETAEAHLDSAFAEAWFDRVRAAHREAAGGAEGNRQGEEPEAPTDETTDGA